MLIKPNLSFKIILYPKSTAIALAFIENSLKPRISLEAQMTPGKVPSLFCFRRVTKPRELQQSCRVLKYQERYTAISCFCGNHHNYRNCFVFPVNQN